MSTGTIATAERVQPPSMTRILNALLSAGMVSRTPHPEDGRLVLYAVTEQARLLVKADRERRDQWLSQRLLSLSPQEREVLDTAIPILNRLALD
jgi:DNA-binding MarR family transcriptional regulator